MKPLDQSTALAMAQRLCDGHRREILRVHKDLEAWALNRAALRGLNYALVKAAGPVLIGGVIDKGRDGYLWFAGADGWQRHLKQAMRFFREVQRSGAYESLECECYSDNPEARQSNGFRYEVTADTGSSHATTEPTWPTTVGATVVDSGA